jgi:hypothetical protein
LLGNKGLLLPSAGPSLRFCFGGDGLISLKSKLRQYPRKTHYKLRNNLLERDSAIEAKDERHWVSGKGIDEANPSRSACSR